MRFLWSLLVIVAAQVVVLPNSLAFEQSRTEYGAPLRLNSLPARVRLDNPVPGFSDGGQSAILQAIASWNADACHAPVLVLTNDDDASIEIVPVANGWRFGSAIAAHTAIDSDPFRGDIRHVVIEIDARRALGHVDGASADVIDIESVILHELGHALGLDHSRNADAIMRAGLKPGQARRILHDDDIAGVCSVTNQMMFGGKNVFGDIESLVRNAPGLVVALVIFVIGVGIVGFALFARMMKRLRIRGAC